MMTMTPITGPTISKTENKELTGLDRAIGNKEQQKTINTIYLQICWRIVYGINLCSKS